MLNNWESGGTFINLNGWQFNVPLPAGEVNAAAWSSLDTFGAGYEPWRTAEPYTGGQYYASAFGNPTVNKWVQVDLGSIDNYLFEFTFYGPAPNTYTAKDIRIYVLNSDTYVGKAYGIEENGWVQVYTGTLPLLESGVQSSPIALTIPE
jgi:hypothetical protein